MCDVILLPNNTRARAGFTDMLVFPLFILSPGNELNIFFFFFLFETELNLFILTHLSSFFWGKFLGFFKMMINLSSVYSMRQFSWL